MLQTPPLEGLKLILSQLMTDQPEDLVRRHDPQDNWVMLVLDVSRAHMIPLCQRDIYLTMPEEEPDYHPRQGVVDV